MDIQGNISIEVINRMGIINKIILDDIQIKKLYELGDPIFEIDEKKGFIIKAELSANYILEIEGPDSIKYIIDSDNKVLKMYFEDDFNYIPGNYFIYIKNDNNSIRSYFKVVPSAMTEKNLFDLRKSIESIQVGLSKDFSRFKASFDLYKYDSSLTNEYIFIEKYKVLSNDLKNIVNRIIKDPKQDLDKISSIKPDIGIKGRESERWFESKGQRVNQVNNSIIFYLESKVKNNADNSVNRIFKSQIKELLEILDNTEKKLRQRNIFLKSRVKTIEIDVEEKKYLIDLTNINSEKEALSRDIYRREQECRELKLRSDVIRNEIDFMESETRYYLRLINLNWLSDVCELKLSDKKAILPLHYKYFMNLVNKLLNPKNRSVNDIRVFDFAYRETSYLFEVYIFLIIHSTLLENGYEALNTEIFHENFGFVDAIVESKLKYKKGNEIIEVRYDIQVNKYSYKKKSDFYNLNAFRNKPDFLISKYLDNSFVDSFIIESKCVKHRYLFNEFESTEISEQLKDYLSFCYVERKDDNYQLKKGIIRKVYVVFPDVDEKMLFRDFEDIVYIGINPSINIIHTNLLKILKEELS